MQMGKNARPRSLGKRYQDKKQWESLAGDSEVLAWVWKFGSLVLARRVESFCFAGGTLQDP